MKRFLFWLPRILTIIFILFISIFALDVFSEYSFPLVLVALFMAYIIGALWGIGLIIIKKETYGK